MPTADKVPTAGKVPTAHKEPTAGIEPDGDVVNSPQQQQTQEALSQEVLSHKAFGLSKELTQSLLNQMEQAGISLLLEPLLDQEGQPGLVFAVKDKTGAMEPSHQEGLIKEVMHQLHDNAVLPSLYTGHQEGGRLAAMVHEEVGKIDAQQKQQAVTFTVDTDTVFLSLIHI